jgi:hypothetical protein
MHVAAALAADPLRAHALHTPLPASLLAPLCAHARLAHSGAQPPPRQTAGAVAAVGAAGIATDAEDEGDADLLVPSIPLDTAPANVWVIQPKFASKKLQKDRDPQLQLEEAHGLAEAVGSWRVVRETMQPMKLIDGQRFFGKGKVEEFRKVGALKHTAHMPCSRSPLLTHSRAQDPC